MRAERPIEYPASLSLERREAYREMVLELRAAVAAITSDTGRANPACRSTAPAARG
jgi:hypothetical protein